MFGMGLFLLLLGVALMLATLFTLIRGLVNMAGMTDADLTGDGPSPRQLKSNKLMWNRIYFQGAALLIFAILLLSLSAKG
jgi:hypothetical protein